MKGIKEAFIDAGEISQMLGIGMTKAYAIIKEYNADEVKKIRLNTGMSQNVFASYM